jgi:hypothetical protein
MSTQTHTVALGQSRDAEFEILERLKKRKLQLRVTGPDGREWEVEVEKTSRGWNEEVLGKWDAEGNLVEFELPEWFDHVEVALE